MIPQDNDPHPTDFMDSCNIYNKSYQNFIPHFDKNFFSSIFFVSLHTMKFRVIFNADA
jgi:hypothetical protein